MSSLWVTDTLAKSGTSLTEDVANILGQCCLHGLGRTKGQLSDQCLRILPVDAQKVLIKSEVMRPRKDQWPDTGLQTQSPRLVFTAGAVV